VALVKQGLVKLYGVNGEEFLQIITWEKHQQIRAKRSKYPDPDDNSPADDSNGNQVLSNVPVIQSNPIQSNPNPKRKAPPEKQNLSFENYIEQLRTEYSDLNFDNELKKFHLYWSEGNKKLKRPKLALKNWMDKAREFKEGKDGKIRGHIKGDEQGANNAGANKFTSGKYGDLVQK